MSRFVRCSKCDYEFNEELNKNVHGYFRCPRPTCGNVFTQDPHTLPPSDIASIHESMKILEKRIEEVDSRIAANEVIKILRNGHVDGKLTAHNAPSCDDGLPEPHTYRVLCSIEETDASGCVTCHDEATFISNFVSLEAAQAWVKNPSQIPF